MKAEKLVRKISVKNANVIETHECFTELTDFIKLAARFVEPEEDYDALRKELREVFMLYDKEARGYLPLDEFKIILREIDPELPEDELDEIIDEIDADGSGTIDFDGKSPAKCN